EEAERARAPVRGAARDRGGRKAPPRRRSDRLRPLGREQPADRRADRARPGLVRLADLARPEDVAHAPGQLLVEWHRLFVDQALRGLRYLPAAYHLRTDPVPGHRERRVGEYRATCVRRLQQAIVEL